jgi:hypothetical protein
MNPDLFDVLKTKPRLYFFGGHWYCVGSVKWRSWGIPRRKLFAYCAHSPRFALLGWQFAALGMVQGAK